MKIRYVYAILFLLCTVTGFAQDAQAILKKATNKLLLRDMELSLEVKEIRKNGRAKEKEFDVLMGTFKDVDKIRMLMQKPDRAKGVTIVVTNTSGKTGLIEILTPANGKVRKMKATAKNMALVGAGGFSSNYLTIDPEALDVKKLGTEEVDRKSYITLEVQEKLQPENGKARLLIDERTFHITQIISFNADSTQKSQTNFYDFQSVEGTTKVYPYKVVTTEAGNSSKTEIKILKVSQRVDIKESDFVLQKRIDE